MILAILFLTLTGVYSASIPKDVNPCIDDELYALRYFHPYTSQMNNIGNASRYVFCDPWNGYVVSDCAPFTLWNTYYGRCSNETLERYMNSSIFNETVMPPMSSETEPMPFSCRYTGKDSCVNGGICNLMPTGGICDCLSNFTGSYCQVVDNSTLGVFGMLINSSFSLELYRQNRPLADEYYSYNGSIDTSSISDNATRERIAKYVALYPNGTMRFDMLVNYLIQDFLSIVYPSQFFLQEFAYPGEIQMGYVNAIPSLLMSSKYAYDRYDDLWAVYEDVLRQLVAYLPRHLPTIADEAERFFQIYDSLFQQFESQAGNFSDMRDPEFFNQSYVTLEMIKSKIHRDFNDSLSYSYDLFRLLNQFDEEIGIRALVGSSNSSYFEQALFNFTASPNVTNTIGQLSDCNADIWDSLSFFGFWYVVSHFVQHQHALNSTTFNSSLHFASNASISRLILPASRPTGAFNKSRTAFDVRTPVFAALQSDNSTDVPFWPIDKRANTTRQHPAVKKPSHKVSSNASTVALKQESDEPRAEQLISLNATALKVVASNWTTMKQEGDARAEKIVAFNVTTPLSLKQESGDEPRAEQLVSLNATALKVVSSNWTVLKQESDKARAEKIVAFNVTAPLSLKQKGEEPKAEQLVSVNMSSTRAQKLAAWNASAEKQESSDEPRAEQIVSLNTTALKVVSSNWTTAKQEGDKARAEKIVSVVNSTFIH